MGVSQMFSIFLGVPILKDYRIGVYIGELPIVEITDPKP